MTSLDLLDLAIYQMGKTTLQDIGEMSDKELVKAVKISKAWSLLLSVTDEKEGD